MKQFTEVVNSLHMPQKVRFLKYITNSPIEILSGSETLAKLSGLESFLWNNFSVEAGSRFTVEQVRDKQFT